MRSTDDRLVCAHGGQRVPGAQRSTADAADQRLRRRRRHARSRAAAAADSSASHVAVGDYTLDDLARADEVLPDQCGARHPARRAASRVATTSRRARSRRACARRSRLPTNEVAAARTAGAAGRSPCSSSPAARCTCGTGWRSRCTSGRTGRPSKSQRGQTLTAVARDLADRGLLEHPRLARAVRPR